MSQPSSVDTKLSPDDKEALNKMIASGRWTLDGLVEWLGEKGYEISRSALHRHSVNVRKVGEQLRQSREMADALVRDLGPAATDGRQGRLLTEILRKLAFDTLVKKMEGEGEELGPNDFFFLGKAIKELAQANRLDQDFEGKVRDRIAAEERDKAAKAAGAVARKAGLSDDVRRRIEEEILGLVR